MTVLSVAALASDDVAIAKNFLADVASGNFENLSVMYDATMKAQVPAKRMEDIWNSVEAQYGKFESVVDANTVTQGIYTVVILTSKFEKAYLDVNVVFDQSSKIAGLHFSPSQNPNYIPKKETDDISIAKTFLTEVANGNFQKLSEMYDAAVKAQLPAKKMEEIWNSLESQYGKFESIAQSKTTKQGNYTIVILTCKFEKAYVDTRVIFDQNSKIAGLNFTPSQAVEYTPPSYVDESSFTQESVTVGTEWKLPGAITVPKGKGPFVGVVLVAGSGPNDMNESIGPNEVFKDIAYGLSSNGIAVLRYDKRTNVYPHEAESHIATFTVRQEVIDDALKAVDLLASKPYISKVYVVGHSLGAMLAPEIALESKGKVAGIVMLAAPARSLPAVTISQLKYLASLSGSATADRQSEALIKEFELLEQHKLKDGTVVMGASAYYYYTLEKYAPTEVLKKLSIPVLIDQGGKDYQVTREDYDIFKSDFGNQKNFTFNFYPDLNHLFMTQEGKPSPDAYYVPSHVNAEVIDGIVSWIDSTSK